MVGLKTLPFIMLCLQFLHCISCAPLKKDDEYQLELVTNFGGKTIKSEKKIHIGDQIGSGQFGTVNTAVMETVNSVEQPVEVAIKAAKPGATDDLNQEARVYDRLESVPGFATYFGSGLAGETPLLVIEKFDSNLEKLSVVYSTKSKFDRKLFSLELMIVGTKILSVLHAKGIVHRDLKPDNFVLRHNKDGSMELALIVFETAQLPEDEATELAGNELTCPLLYYRLDPQTKLVATPEVDLEGLFYVSDYLYDRQRRQMIHDRDIEADKKNLSLRLKDIYEECPEALSALENMLTEVRERKETNPFNYGKHLTALEMGLKVLDSKRPSKATYKIGTLKMNQAKENEA